MRVHSSDVATDCSEQLGAERHLLRSLLSSIEDVFYAVDSENRFLVVNQAAAELFGQAGPELMSGMSLASVSLEEEFNLARAENLAVFQTGVPLTDLHCWISEDRAGHVRHFDISKTPLRDKDGAVFGVVVRGRDTSRLNQLTEKLHYQAEHDSVTGLLNRRGFTKRLRLALQDFAESARPSVLCSLDIDQFRIINDTLGHRLGDRLLLRVSQMLGQKIRQSDTLARIGGDEFGIILAGCGIADASRQIEALLERVDDFRFQAEGRVFGISASIGLVEISNNTSSLQVLLSKADVACYAAKDKGRGRWHVFSDEDSTSIRHQSELEQASDIHSALLDNRFVLYAQPIAKFRDGALQTHHHEILVRMVDRMGRLVSPGLFIPAAERYDLMGGVDRWVIRHAFSNFDRVYGADPAAVITINLSGNSLNDPQMADYIKTQLREHELDPHRVVFELTETAFVSSFDEVQTFIDELSTLGCEFALDDFGSGLSSFSYLKNFKVKYLKIDGSFIRNITSDRIDRELVAAMNQVGHALGIETIAEFVESPEHIAVLRSLGVDYLQGYAIGKPAPLLAAELTH